MDSVIHSGKNIYHTIINTHIILIVSEISMIDIFLKKYLSYFYCKKRVSITPILYLFSVALGESIHLKA